MPAPITAMRGLNVWIVWIISFSCMQSERWVKCRTVFVIAHPRGNDLQFVVPLDLTGLCCDSMAPERARQDALRVLGRHRDGLLEAGIRPGDDVAHRAIEGQARSRQIIRAWNAHRTVASQLDNGTGKAISARPGGTSGTDGIGDENGAHQSLGAQHGAQSARWDMQAIGNETGA